MTQPHSIPDDPSFGTVLPPATVLCVSDGGDPVGPGPATLADDDEVTVLTASSTDEALEDLDDVDVVVSDHAPSSLDAGELLDELRAHDPQLPVLLVADQPDPSVLERLLSAPLTDHLSTAAAATDDLLSTRVRRLVGQRRQRSLSRRVLAAVETTDDGVAIVDPDGRIAFVDGVYARRFGYERDAVVGRSWQDCFTPETVEQIETSALSAVADGWRWSAPCVGVRADGEPFTVRTTVTGVDDGSLVFVLGDGE
jgi:PAS domain S-box-containing protein